MSISRGTALRPTKEQKIIYLLDRVYKRLEDLESAFNDLYKEKEELSELIKEVYEQNKRLVYEHRIKK